MCVQEEEKIQKAERSSVKGSLRRRQIQKGQIMKDAELSTVLTLRVVLLCQLIHLLLVPPLFARHCHTLCVRMCVFYSCCGDMHLFTQSHCGDRFPFEDKMQVRIRFRNTLLIPRRKFGHYRCSDTAKASRSM